MLAVVWPFGFSARFADPGGAQTRCACMILNGLFSLFLRSSEGSGVEGHRSASFSFWTDRLRLLPRTPSTSMKNLAACLMTAD